MKTLSENGIITTFTQKDKSAFLVKFNEDVKLDFDDVPKRII